MKVLELMHSLEEAYDRFGDIDVHLCWAHIDFGTGNSAFLDAKIKELVIESEEFIIKCESK